MASIRIRIYGDAAEEISRLFNGQRPKWVAQLLVFAGHGPDEMVASASMEALAEELGRRLRSLALILRAAERRGWAITVEGDSVLISSGLAQQPTRQALEEDGVWQLVARLVGQGQPAFVP